MKHGRLIDGDALMPKLKFIQEAEYQIYGKESWGFASKCIAAVEDAPTIEERKTGEWEEIEVIADAYDISGVKTWASKMKCNQCGFTTIAIEGHFSQYNFCPNCGADMRNEQE